MSFVGTSRFVPIRLLGTGGMGTVYLVTDGQLGTQVALKTLNLSSGTDLYLFKREFRAFADIKHPNLVNLYELISDGTLWFFTMEYVEGLAFDRYLLGTASTVRAADGEAPALPLPLPGRTRVDRERLVQSVRQLCEGVHAMHESGCIHRDLKPSNVLVTPEGRVVVLDFGLAKQSGGDRASMSGGLSGTPAYMAPEQALEESCLPAADWYSVGVMIYEVLAGRCPFEGAMFDVLLRKQTEEPPFPTEINPDADEILSDLCMRMIHRDPSRRPSGAEILTRVGVGRDRRALTPITRRTPIGTPTFNVLGRAQELKTLYESYAKVRKGKLAIVVVEGSSGIGKTSLVETFLEDLQSHRTAPASALVLRGRCHERETLPFKALDNVVDGISHRLASLDTSDQAYVLPGGILYLCEIFPVLRRAKLAENPRYFLPPLRDAKELRNQAFVAFCDLLRHLAKMQPLVIFIDDLQWADSDSFALLQAITQQPGAPALLLVASCRKTREAGGGRVDPLLRELLSHPDVASIELGPLSPEDSRSLVGDLMADDEVSPPDRRRIIDTVVREAAGNPFFVVEMVQHFRTRLLQGGLAGTTDEQSLRLDAMILERVGQLPQESQVLLQILALAGDPLPQRVLATAIGVPLGCEAWERGISALLDGSLIRRRGRQGTDVVEPFHDRIREAVATSLDKETSHRLHVRLAEAIEQSGRERADMLARYWLSAEDHERAKRYAVEAAAEARAKLAFDRAAQLYESAAALEADPKQRTELLRTLGDCRASSGRALLAAEAYLESANLDVGATALRLRHLAAEQLLRGGQIVRGLDVIKDVLKEAGLNLPSSPGRAVLSVVIRMLWLRLRGLRFEERPASSISPESSKLLDIYWSVNTGLGVVDTLRAVDFLLRFIGLALRTGDIRRVSQGFAILGGQVAALGGRYFGWATRLVSEAEVLARRSSHPATIGLARMSKAIVRYFSGEVHDAANELIAVEQYFLNHCHGMGWELATTRTFACLSLSFAGRVRELCERFDRYIADADRTGDRYLAANLRTYPSVVWLVRDDVARARKDIEGCLDSWPSDVYQVQHYFHLKARCEQAIYAGEPRVAYQAIADEQPRLGRSGLLRVEGLRMDYHWICGRTAIAVAETVPESQRPIYLEEARHHARLLGRAYTQVAISLGQVVQAAVRNLTPGADPEHARMLLERAVATAESSGTLLLAESARRWLGEMTGGRRGRELRALSNGWMADQGVQNPARLAHLMAPGLRRASADA
jgi:eukaryotic-like serine/threonine-protein kinase